MTRSTLRCNQTRTGLKATAISSVANTEDPSPSPVRSTASETATISRYVPDDCRPRQQRNSGAGGGPAAPAGEQRPADQVSRSIDGDRPAGHREHQPENGVADHQQVDQFGPAQWREKPEHDRCRDLGRGKAKEDPSCHAGSRSCANHMVILAVATPR
jgi:hypothetical protein